MREAFAGDEAIYGEESVCYYDNHPPQIALSLYPCLPAGRSLLAMTDIDMTAKQVFALVYKISKQLKIDAYVVGGFVRDELLDREQKKDVDIVVAGSGLKFAKAFAEAVGEDAGSLVEFPEFDTARVILGIRNHEPCLPAGRSGIMEKIDVEIEFAGARSESYRSTSRKPFVESATIEQDLSRRDFTVNAMARKIGAGGKLGKLLDPFGGRIDLKKRLLRTPQGPDETFSDDPLRMLRAARFAAQLEVEIDQPALSAMHRNRSRMSIVSAERIQEELLKLLSAKKPSVGLWLLVHTGLLDLFLPEVSALSGVEDMYGHRHKDNLSHSIQVVDNIAEHSENVLLRFAGLLHDIGKPATKKFLRGRGWTFDMHEHVGRKMVRAAGKRLRMSAADIEYMAMLVRWHMQPINLMDEGVTDSAVRRLIVNLKDVLPDLLLLCRSDITTGNPNKKERRLKNYDYLEKRIAEVVEIDKLREFQSPVRGEEIMAACSLKPGPTVGKLKKAVEEAILEGIIPNDYEAAKKYFEEIKGRYMDEAEEWERV